MVASNVPDEFLISRLDTWPDVLGKMSTDNKVVLSSTSKNTSQLMFCVPMLPPWLDGVNGPTLPVVVPTVAAT